MRLIVPLAVVLALPAASALAQDNGRFTMTPTPEGFLKLDSRTGTVSHCLRQGSDYQCRLVPDERSALQDEIDRLTRENAALRSGTPANPSAPQATPTPGLPSESDVDHAMSLMERFIRRFRDIMREDGSQNRL